VLTGLGVVALDPGMAAPRSATGGFAARKQRGRSCATSRPGGFDLERLLEDCQRARTSGDAQAAVHEVLAREVTNPGAVLRGLGEPAKGGIRTLYRSPDLTVLNIIWSPLMQLMPHEHRMWSVIGIYVGREDNIFWRRQAGSVAAAQAAAVWVGEVVSLADDVIHSVANPIEKFTGAIHVYGGDFFATARSEWDPETLAERSWNIQKAMQIFKESNDRFAAWKGTPGCA
jgi:predicted metal-dependent enzyme (double-stranded beta helix superfamily)